MKLQFLGIIAVLFLLAGCANLPSQNTWNSLTGQDGRTWGYTQIQEAAQAKAIFSRPFNAKGRGRTYSRHQIKFDQIVLPPNSLNTLKLRTYCLDKSDPAPKRNEKLYLVPVGKMIDSQIFPIYSSLMKYSHSHPEKHTQIQRIVWNLRSTKNPSEIRNEDYALLDTIHPGASQIVHSYFNTKKLTGMATDLIADTAGKFLNQHGLGTSLLNQQNLVSTALHSLSQSNSQVDSILRSLESMPVSGLIPNDNSDYSLLTDGVAVKATHRGGARNSELTIKNTTDHPVVFQPAQFALESKRKTQRLGVGGVDKIQEESEKQNNNGNKRHVFVAFSGFGGSDSSASSSEKTTLKRIIRAVDYRFSQNKINNELFSKELFSGYYDSDEIDAAVEYIEQYISKDKNNKQTGKIVIYGYSWGGDSAVELAEKLKAKNYNIDLLFTVDASAGPLGYLNARQTIIPDNVKTNLNFYMKPRYYKKEWVFYLGQPHKALNPNKTKVVNKACDVSSHTDMDEYTEIRAMDEISNSFRD
ncbi:MAG: hypothetical protein D3920_00495 [Candidatus Electrothrix sp. AW2]|nr:hypothetical protein [Candidatus Electrothrix gigas]